jgi:hypothetical protein
MVIKVWSNDKFETTGKIAKSLASRFVAAFSWQKNTHTAAILKSRASGQTDVRYFGGAHFADLKICGSKFLGGDCHSFKFVDPNFWEVIATLLNLWIQILWILNFVDSKFADLNFVDQILLIKFLGSDCHSFQFCRP